MIHDFFLFPLESLYERDGGHHRHPYPPLQAVQIFHRISSSKLHLERVVETSSSELGSGAQLLLDAQQLVVLGEALASARSARLQLSAAETDRQIGNKRVLRFAATMRHLHPPAGVLRHSARLDCLRDRSNLVHLMYTYTHKSDGKRLLLVSCFPSPSLLTT